ncbi:hypothetical protein ACFU6S_21590 [Streptomyces sp. NPDC057456]|uniref:hypothetical protein n=1 Tax=Streptomyces sp. NPDC057456 TaxID=3346139 RepID=UPI0036ADE2BA
MSHGPDGNGTTVQYERDGAWVVVAHGDYDTNTITPLEEALDTAARKHTRVPAIRPVSPTDDQLVL